MDWIKEIPVFYGVVTVLAILVNTQDLFDLYKNRRK